MWRELTREAVIDASIQEVFDFFSDAGNLERITPPSLRFRILTPRPIRMRRGVLIDYELKICGMRVRWRTEITVWDPPHAFVDTQQRGPYRRWIHRHEFEPVDAHSTRMRDRVRYQLPFRPFGEIAYPIVALQLRRIFEHRQQTIQELF